MSDYKKALPTHEEIEKLITEAFPTPGSMCPLLCTEREDLINLLEDVTSQKEKALILIKLHAISAQIQQLHCNCVPQ